MEGWTSASKVRDRSQSGRGGAKTEGTCEREAAMEGREREREKESGVGGWVQIKPSSGGLTCLECVSEPAWLRDRHSAPGLWKFSATSRRPVCGHTHRNTHSYLNRKITSMNTKAHQHLNTDMNTLTVQEHTNISVSNSDLVSDLPTFTEFLLYSKPVSYHVLFLFSLYLWILALLSVCTCSLLQ